MTKSRKNLPKDVIDSWPEVFEEVKYNVLPLRYIQSVHINFKDNTVWEIKITAKVRNEGWESFEKILSETVQAYEHRIENVDFKLDTDRVKKDIKKKTDKFLSKKTI